MNIDAIRDMVQRDHCAYNAFAPEVRAAVGRYGRWRHDQGASWAQVAAEVGLSTSSVRKWSMRQETAGFQQVVLVDDAPVVESLLEDPLVITAPSGFTLTGCSLEQAIAVLRSLA